MQQQSPQLMQLRRRTTRKPRSLSQWPCHGHCLHSLPLPCQHQFRFHLPAFLLRQWTSALLWTPLQLR